MSDCNCAIRRFQSALRINGPSNSTGWPLPAGRCACFNPPCGSMALRTTTTACHTMPGTSFNPPCGSMALRTACAAAIAWQAARFQSALRINGPSNWLRPRSCQASADGFNPPCGSMALRTARRDERRVCLIEVSIRLADQWPFERRCGEERGRGGHLGFNPPCGSMALRTVADPSRLRRTTTGFNPPCGSMALRTQRLAHSPALRTRFNPPCGSMALRTWPIACARR